MKKRSHLTFKVGDEVRAGMQVGRVTDVGTVLIQVKTSEGRRHVLCPWELVKTRAGDEAPDRKRSCGG